MECRSSWYAASTSSSAEQSTDRCGQLPHVHLLSSFRYPVSASLPLENAAEYLLQAPKIVKELMAMSWTYIQNPPPDGTVMLAWQPSSQLQSRFASDGYVWADPESTYTFETRGYVSSQAHALPDWDWKLIEGADL